ncbi:YdcF family protein [Candidatus Woesearchaeota archaeon]|nr:YdcF family protein [Candidatus Woesearchaeota archaeon]
MKKEEYGVIIIPGQGASNGILPTDSKKDSVDIRMRLKYAIRIFKRQQNKPILILSGYGMGDRKRPDNEIEANAMYNYIKPLINPYFLVKENQSKDSYENAKFSYKKIEKDVKNILILLPAKSFNRTEQLFRSLNTIHKLTFINVSKYSESENEENFCRVQTLVLKIPFCGKQILGFIYSIKRDK